MFTGIVSAVGRIAKATREAGNGKRETGLTLTIQAPYKGLKKGESIAVNGACLTVERALPGGFTVHVVETTEGRTLFGEYAVGRPVKRERTLRARDRLGGHIVQGHVDGVAVVQRVERRENEGDLVGAAERVTPEMINFMATHARGLICLTLLPERCQALGLTQMAEHNTEAHET